MPELFEADGRHLSALGKELLIGACTRALSGGAGSGGSVDWPPVDDAAHWGGSGGWSPAGDAAHRRRGAERSASPQPADDEADGLGRTAQLPFWQCALESSALLTHCDFFGAGRQMDRPAAGGTCGGALGPPSYIQHFVMVASHPEWLRKWKIRFWECGTYCKFAKRGEQGDRGTWCVLPGNKLQLVWDRHYVETLERCSSGGEFFCRETGFLLTLEGLAPAWFEKLFPRRPGAKRP